MAKKAKLRYFLKDGSPCPGVTTIISNNLGWNKNMLIAWSRREALKGNDPELIKQEAADIGTIAHYLCECDAKGIEPNLKQYPQDQTEIAQKCFAGYLDWKKLYKIGKIQSEIPLTSEQYRYGGQIDMLYTVEDKLILGDIKTSNDIYVEHKIQVAAYAQLCSENGYNIQEIFILKFSKKDGGFSVHKIDRIKQYWEIFKHCLDLDKLKNIG